ncbi:MAG: hypothetical protein ACE5HO_21840 [bacterium]
MRNLVGIWFLAVISLCNFMALQAQQEEGIPTKILVRAIAHDAKVIGTQVGGARITVREAATGKVLAEGLQQGSTGDTQAIMIQPRERGKPVYDTPGTAGFLATINLKRPTVVEITAEGPLGTPQSTQKATRTLLLVPGQDVLGEGILVELYGFTVELLVPEQTDWRLGQELAVRAKLTML